MSDPNMWTVIAREGDTQYHLDKHCPTVVAGDFSRISRVAGAKRHLKLCGWCREAVRSA